MIVVGEVENVKLDSLDAPAAPQIVVPVEQLTSTIAPELQAAYLPGVIRSI
jgi:hypothetical protein